MKQIFSPEKLAVQKQHATEHLKQADFLFDFAARVMAERLKDVNRTFETAVVLGDLYVDKLKETLLETAKIKSIKVSRIEQETLPFQPQSQDCFIAFMSLHQMNDLPGVLIQARRALKPDGLFMGVMIGGETLYEAKEVFQAVELAQVKGASMHFHPYADKQQMGGLMQRAGFALPVVDSDVLDVSYGSLSHLMDDLKNMGEGYALSEEQPSYTPEFLAAAEEQYKLLFPDQQDVERMQASFELIYLLGWSPHDSQQQPLKPGTAKERLADALDEKEVIVHAED